MNADRIRKLESYRWLLIGLEGLEAVLPSRSGKRPFFRWMKSLWLLLQNEMARTFPGWYRSAHHDVYPPRELLAKHLEECDVRQVGRSLVFAELVV